MITQEDRDMFTLGCCYELANEVHKLTGWQRCTFGFRGQPDIHVFVRTPAGTYVDVNGEQTEQQLLKHWGSEHGWLDTKLTIMEAGDDEVGLFGGMVDWFDTKWPGHDARAHEVAKFIVSGILETS